MEKRIFKWRKEYSNAIIGAFHLILDEQKLIDRNKNRNKKILEEIYIDQKQ